MNLLDAVKLVLEQSGVKVQEEHKSPFSYSLTLFDPEDKPLPVRFAEYSTPDKGVLSEDQKNDVVVRIAKMIGEGLVLGMNKTIKEMDDKING